MEQRMNMRKVKEDDLFSYIIRIVLAYEMLYAQKNQIHTKSAILGGFLFPRIALRH